MQNTTNQQYTEEILRLALLLSRNNRRPHVAPSLAPQLPQLLAPAAFPFPAIQYPTMLLGAPVPLLLPQQQQLPLVPRLPVQVAARPPPQPPVNALQVLRTIGKTGEYVDVVALPGLTTLEHDICDANRFPSKLHTMLRDGSKRGWDSVVCFEPHGRAFRIHKRDAFVPILAQYFNQTKIESFQRQLNLWGFRLIRHGTDTGCYYHPLFLRSHPQLCAYMHRIAVKPNGRKLLDAQPHPNLAVMRRG